MKKSYLFKFFVFAVIAAFVTITSCKDYDDDISRIDTELSAVKADLVKKSDLTALETALKGQIATLQTELNALKGSVLTQEKLDAAMALVVKLETFNAFKTTVEADIVKLKADVAKAATKEELAAIDAALKSQINQVKLDLAAHIANFEALQAIVSGHSTAIAGLETQLAAQLALINANKAEIAAVKADLQAKYNELTGLIQQNADDIAALDGKVEQYKSDLDASIAAVKAELKGLIINVYQSLDHRVYTLTFIPDYTSEDGTPQIVVRGITEWKYNKPAKEYYYTPDWDSDWDENWSVLKVGTIYKGITILRYNVSPSNVQLSDFEITALLHKTSLLRSADTKSAPIVLAGQATLANGVLSVPVVVEESSYDYEDGSWWGNDYAPQATTTRNSNPKWESNVSVALQVKNINVEMDNEEDRYVTSTEYVKVNFDLSEGRVALNEKSLKPDGTILPVGIEYDEIAGSGYASDISLWNGKSQNGNMADVLNHTINLNDFIYGIFDDYYGDWEKMKEFGFNTHTFKFKRVYLESEGVNQTNDYVTLNETTGVIGVKADGNKVNQAAVGRTPIVEVTALVNGKVHAVGYIKIIITDNFDNSDVKFEFTLEDYVLGCNSTYKLTDVDIAAIDFDQVFNHARIQLGKDAFFQEYKQGGLTAAQVTLVTGPAGATVGVDNTKHVWFKYAIDPQTQSVNLFNYLEGFIRNDAPAGTYKVTTRLKSNGYRPDVVITWNFKVKLPTGISLTANTIYYKNGGIVVNPTIMEQGALTSTAYEALLNNTFMHESNSFVYTGLTEACQQYLTPYFVFTEAPSGFTISNDKKSLWKGGSKAAEIVQDGTRFYVRLETIGNYPPSGPWGNNPPFSDAAKQLVGKTVKVQPRAYINEQPSNVINLFDPFTVHFTYPLTLQFPDNAKVFDQANDGVKNTYTLNLYNPTVIKDWNGKLISVLTQEGRDLIDHYEIAFVQDWLPGGWFTPGTTVYYSPFVLGDPQINLQPDGTIGETFHPIPMGTDMKIEISNVVGQTYINPFYGSMNTPASIKLKWTNSATGAVQNEFMVRIPVSVKHKWSPNAEPLQSYLYVTVKPGNGN
ncbi:MAG TPA: hypothetical protein GXX42_00785 [Petrimonas sp.]|uniref:coiled-coil domain-containing protein n=1 Tax=Petrimonas sp. TaxID=2023866 RepID=UPI00175439A2|nr:hypothetical protein [Petrimonas sp.]